jgi:hypothetical protein
MRWDRDTLLAVLLCLALSAGGGADDKADEALVKQKKAVAENWDKLAAGEMATHETEHLLLVAPKEQQKKLKGLGEQLEKYHDAAAKLLFGDKDRPWAGKLAVYVFDQPETYDAFVRRVEKRRLLGEENGTYAAEDDAPHVAVCPPRTPQDPAADLQAGQHVAMVVLARKAGAKTPLPAWLKNGFGRATLARVAPSAKTVAADRRKIVLYVGRNNRNLTDVFNGALEGEEATLLGASAADFLTYGPGRPKLAKLLEGFKPGENGEPKSIYQALETAELKADMLNPLWRRFAAGR